MKSKRIEVHTKTYSGTVAQFEGFGDAHIEAALRK